MEREQLTPEQMDNAVAAAGEELVDQNIVIPPELADWWRRWYLKAGHKRLGRIIMAVK